MALSTLEAEYIAVNLAAQEAVWLHTLLMGLFGQMLEPTVIHCDNQSCVKLSENPIFHDRSKHVEIQCHYIRDMVQAHAIKLQYIPTDDQIAYILTKPLSKGKFVYF